MSATARIERPPVNPGLSLLDDELIARAAAWGDELGVSVDPGGEHVGIAIFRDADCIDALELPPALAIVLVRELLSAGAVALLLVEKWQLYPDVAPALAYSSLPTVEVIGVMRYLWACHGDLGDGAWVELVQQPASIMKPTAAICKARKIRSTAARLKAGGHAKAAELHGRYYYLRRADPTSVPEDPPF